MDNKYIPKIFQQLQSKGCLEESEILKTEDGFWAAYKSLSEILFSKNIVDFPDSNGEMIACKNFFDDWFLYAIDDENGCVCSLFKMREQEQDLKNGFAADGDIPGVAISFIEFMPDFLLDCIDDPDMEKRKLLAGEINRVAAYKGQKHSEKLKRYFVSTESRGAYMVSKLYAKHIASFAENGFVSVPERYLACYRKKGAHGRLPGFIEDNNKKAKKTVCDHEKIYIHDPKNLTEHEMLAILATHTGNTSFFSFAAEVQFHAKFLVQWAKIGIPFMGKSLYSSAIRADMSIGDAAFFGFLPYYRQKSLIVKKQYDCHKNI